MSLSTGQVETHRQRTSGVTHHAEVVPLIESQSGIPSLNAERQRGKAALGRCSVKCIEHRAAHAVAPPFRDDADRHLGNRGIDEAETWII